MAQNRRNCFLKRKVSVEKFLYTSLHLLSTSLHLALARAASAKHLYQSVYRVYVSVTLQSYNSANAKRELASQAALRSQLLLTAIFAFSIITSILTHDF
jgi:hypothetical protein